MTPEDRSLNEIAELETKMGEVRKAAKLEQNEADSWELLAKTLKHRLVVEYNKEGKAVGVCEDYAKAHPRYRVLMAKYIKHKRKSGVLWAELSGMEAALNPRLRKFDYWRTKEATEREKIKRGIYQ